MVIDTQLILIIYSDKLKNSDRTQRKNNKEIRFQIFLNSKITF